jgi:hypothetical protein
MPAAVVGADRELAGTSFIMHGARAAMAAGLVHIDQQVSGIERAVHENPGLAFDLAKTLIETACKTILAERGTGTDRSAPLPKLFREVTQVLPFLPVGASIAAETRRSLAQTLNGLSTAVQGVCELRNACGFASHGSDRPRPAMEAVQALLAAATADAIVGFLHRVHTQGRPTATEPQVEFGANDAFNDYVDGAHEEIRIFESEFRASEVLFRLEPETYRIYLAEYAPDGDDGVEAPL